MKIKHTKYPYVVIFKDDRGNDRMFRPARSAMEVTLLSSLTMAKGFPWFDFDVEIL
jgi:hypothetical protein